MYPQRASDIADSMGNTQYVSKSWLVKQMGNWVLDESPEILIIGGWYGTYLVPMLQESFPGCKITLTDKDPLTVEIASELHKKTDNCVVELLDVDAPTKDYTVDVMINTSCEHMKKTGHRVITNNATCLYVLQSCDNTDDPGHINTPKDTLDFQTKCNLTTELYCGRIDLGHKNRFMMIGFR
jgi:hypothetical protein